MNNRFLIDPVSPGAPTYIGRFAPSPSGPLHAGSLIAALASWLDARANQGQWLLRIEDIDIPRCRPEHADRIIRSLDHLGLHWDGPVSYQSRRQARYQTAFERLRHTDRVFPCACSRKQLRRAQPGLQEVVYPGTCRRGLAAGQIGRTWRFSIPATTVCFKDRLHGPQSQIPTQQCGDFVVRRADGLFAYQLVVVVDDAEQNINQVVRGADLLESTGRQILLQRALGYPQPRYLHIPVLLDERNHKLSKQNGALEIPWQTHPADCLNAALAALGQPRQTGPSARVLDCAIEAWDCGKIPHRLEIPSAGGMPDLPHLAN